MRKKFRVLLMTILFVLSFSGFVYAEEFSFKNNGDPTPILWGSQDRTAKIKSFSYISNFSGWINHADYLSNGIAFDDYNLKQVFKDQAGTHEFITCDYNIAGLSFNSVSVDVPDEESNNFAITSVTLCDGTTLSFTDPITPPPPDDGGNTGGTEPPSGGNLPPGTDWGAVDDSKIANACGGGRWTSPIRNWVDNIFCPVITFLDLARSKLAAVSLMMGQGLNIGQYFKIFGDLPTSWQLVVSSLLLMVATLGGLLIFRSAMRIYYSIKEGVKWW